MQNRDTKQPNVVIIYMDDLAYGDLACHGNPYTHTPNLDRLYTQSTRLNRYCSGPLCTPARVSLMTGRYPFRTRAIDTYCGRSMMDPDEVTLAEVLRDAGYRTCISGKWHLGDNYPMRAMDKGFEEAYVHNGGGLRQPANIGRAGYFDPQLMHNGKLVDSKGYCTDIFADHACQFMREHRDEPFFVYLATNAPHTPLEIGDEWVDRYRSMDLPETYAKLYGMVENIDHNVGKVMSTLVELGLEENTIVIYSSDHGPCGSTNHDGQNRFNCNLRGIKGSVYDGGLRVPSFWRYPRQFEADRDLNMVTNPIDILPTITSLCSAKLPTDRTIDGRDLTAWLTNQKADDDWSDRNVFIQWHRGNAPQRYRNFAAYDTRYKLARSGTAFELYDMIDDPTESADIATQHPEIVDRLKTAYDQWFDDVSATRGEGNYDPPPIHIGTEHENPTMLTIQDRRVGDDETWAIRDHGHWVLRVVSQGTYQIALRFEPPQTSGRLTLRCESAELEAQIAAGQTEHTFADVAIAAGNTTVEASLETETDRYDPGFIAFISQEEVNAR